MPAPILYRAQARGTLRAGAPIRRHPGRRLPSNVPFVVDNIWEYTRPEGMPSRRHSVYASPSAELALKSASQGEPDRAGYVVCRVELVGTPPVMQIGVEDARDHPDVKAVLDAILRTLRLDDWAAAPLPHKLALAPLFLPGVTRDELATAVACDALLASVVRAAAGKVTIWTAPPCLARGEIFFEPGEGDAYILHLVDEDVSVALGAA